MQFEVGKTYKTRNAMSAKIIAIEDLPFNGYYKIIGIAHVYGRRVLCCWNSLGKVNFEPNSYNELDLTTEEVSDINIH